MFARLLRLLSRDRRSSPPARRPSRRRPFSLESLEERMLLSAPEITVLDGTGVITSGSTTPIDIGTVQQGQVAPTRIFSLSNDGDATLTLGSLNLPAGFVLLDGLY